jgi:hypothetical protein
MPKIDPNNWDDQPLIESVNPYHALGIRPFCRCCGGGEIRGRRGKYTRTKAASHADNVRNLNAKPKHKDHRRGR